MPSSRKPPAKLIHTFCDLAHHDANVAQLQAMLTEYPELLNTPRPGKDKETALGAATHMRARKVIRFLLDQGVARDVFAACALGDHEAVEAFLDRAPKLVARRAGHIHNMDLIDLAPTEAMVELLVKRGYPLTIHVAAAKGMMAQIDRLLAADPALLEARGREGETPLFSAIWSGQDAAALQLLQRGCQHDVDGADARPLTYACVWGRSRVVRALLDKGVEINYIGLRYRFSHLHACCFWGDEGMGTLDGPTYTTEMLTIILWLFQAGIDPRLRDKKRLTAHQLAQQRGFAERAVLIEELSNVRLLSPRNVEPPACQTSTRPKRRSKPTTPND